jgi:hypothetical protein
MKIGTTELCCVYLSNHRMYYLPKRACSTAFPSVGGAPSDRLQRHGSHHSLTRHAAEEPNDPDAARTLNSSRAHIIEAL